MNKDYSSGQGFADSGPVYLQISIKSRAMYLVGRGCFVVGFFPQLMQCLHHQN